MAAVIAIRVLIFFIFFLLHPASVPSGPMPLVVGDGALPSECVKSSAHRLRGLPVDRGEGGTGSSGGIAVSEMVSFLLSAATAVYYARIVADCALRRRLLDAAGRIAGLVHDSTGATAGEVADQAEALLHQTVNARPDSETADLMTDPTLTPTPIRTGAATWARWLTAVVAVLAEGASTAGLWLPGLYAGAAAVEAMLRGYDRITLVVVAPLLALTLVPGWRDRPAAHLLRASMLAYSVYNYAYCLFGAGLNAGLLAYLAIFTASLFGLVLSLVAVDMAGLAARFRARTPARAVAVIMLLLGLPLAAFQLSGLAGFAVTGVVPQEPSQLVVPLVFTRLGAVLDLALLVPVYLLAAVWLWRRPSWGYLLASVVLVAGFVHQLSYMAGMASQRTAAIPGAAFDPVEPLIDALFAAGAGLLLANLRAAQPERPPTRPGPPLTATSG